VNANVPHEHHLVFCLLMNVQSSRAVRCVCVDVACGVVWGAHSAAIVGTGVGVVLLGPILGVVLGLVSNYVAKTDNDAGEAARGVGKAALELFNYFAKINAKYDVTGKVSDTTKDVVTKIKESSGDDSVISQLEEVRRVAVRSLGGASFSVL
jgi:hypothetical protein